MDFIEYNGRRYYRASGNYYRRRDRKTLHRVVWEEAHGPIPKGHHIHHIDGNRANNALANLVCLTIAEHRRIHISPRATEWHRSEVGRAWHRAHGKATAVQYSLPPTVERVCEQCGKTFFAHQRNRRYCSEACAQNARMRAGNYHEDRTCVICDKAFVVTFKYRATATCSRSCSQRLRWSRAHNRKDETATTHI